MARHLGGNNVEQMIVGCMGFLVEHGNRNYDPWNMPLSAFNGIPGGSGPEVQALGAVYKDLQEVERIRMPCGRQF